MELGLCIEMALTKLPFEDRFKAAADTGFTNVEMWFVEGLQLLRHAGEAGQACPRCRRPYHQHGYRSARRLHRRRHDRPVAPKTMAGAGEDDARVQQGRGDRRFDRLHRQHGSRPQR